MAICSTCKSESPRVRSRWDDKGQLPDICPNCSPESFEKFTVPSDKKIWMGWEAHPNEYTKIYTEDGDVVYERKKEYRAEQETRLTLPTEEESIAQKRAIAKKRRDRRTRPMDEIELAFAKKRAEEIAGWIYVSAMQGTDVN